MPAQKEIATLGGGCFWCLEAVYERLEGVERVASGYAGGTHANPSYEDVCSGETGHAEVVQVTFDPGTVSYREILEVFFSIHDPTTLNRQGADAGTQYRSAIFTHSPEQKRTAETLIAELSRDRVFKGPIVTLVEPQKEFYAAEDYHQHYYARNPGEAYCRAVIAPKLDKFRKRWQARLKAV